VRPVAVVALLLVSSCTKQEKQDVGARPPASASSASPSATAETEIDASIPASSWSKKATDDLELAATPDRGVLLVYGGDYRIRRGEATTRLPREWFGVGPPRHDLSLSADGNTLAVPVTEPSADEGAAVILYDTRARRFNGRFAVPKKDMLVARDGVGKVSGDGNTITWTFTGRPCMVTDVASNKLDVDAAKHAKCK
jgi:hypothetical protein